MQLVLLCRIFQRCVLLVALSYLVMTNFCVAFTFSCVVERFLIERRKTKAKGITMANQNRRN